MCKDVVLKNVTSLNSLTAKQLNNGIEWNNSFIRFDDFWNTLEKDPAKGSAVDNCRPIPCLSLMWKLITGMIADKMYCYLERGFVAENRRDFKVNHLLFMHDLKFFGKNKKQSDSHVQTVHILPRYWYAIWDKEMWSGNSG